MNVLVTGGTGFVGREVVRHLSSARHRVTVLVRPGKARTGQGQRTDGEAVAQASLDDVTSVTRCLQGMDAIVHLVGIISEVGDQTFDRVHVQGTRSLVAAASAAGVRRFVHMSALGTRPGAASRYHQTKWAAEELVRGSGLDWTIFRPSLIYGPRDQFVNLFARMARWSPILPVMGPGRGLLQPISVDAVAQAFAGALSEQRASRATFDLCGLQRLMFVEVLDAILAATGRRRLKLHVSLAVARLQAGLLERLYPALLGQAPPLNRDQLLMLQEDNVGDPGPAASMFGLRLESFSDGIGRFIGH